MAKGKDKQKSSEKKKPLKTLLEKRKIRKTRKMGAADHFRLPKRDRVKLYNPRNPS